MELRPCQIKYIDLHHTAGNESSIGQIRNEHIQRNGWGDIGYNAVVFPDGSIPTLTNSDGVTATGRSLKWSGAHNPGLTPDGSGYTMNQKSFGLSHVGNFETGTMPEVQFNASTKKCAELCKELGIIPSKATIRRHSDDHATACPGKNFPYDKYVAKVIELYNGATAPVEEEPYVVPTGENITPLAGGYGWIESLPDSKRVIIHADKYTYLSINGGQGTITAHTKGKESKQII